MFGYALRHPKLPASNGIVNKAGLTPLTLACKLGRAEVFREMLELSAKEFWRYSNITCSAYPLNALDTILPSGKTSNKQNLKKTHTHNYYRIFCRLEFSVVHNFKRYERGAFRYVRWRHNPAIVGRKMENFC